jgi:DNA (cytosine-5)-methyltransferase 1
VKPTLGSLFAGIGGIDLGFERAGFKTLWQVEIDPYCRKVLERHFPDAERFEDVRRVGIRNLRPVDCLAGGFPCQDVSNTGKGAGLDGERSGLWFEFDRLIGELRPRIVFVENVASLLVRGFGRVLGCLAARGYDAQWDCIRAFDVGAPHLRDRIWIVAYPHGSRCSEQDFFSEFKGRAETFGSREDVPHSRGERHQGQRSGRDVGETSGNEPRGSAAGSDHEGDSVYAGNNQTTRFAEHGGEIHRQPEAEGFGIGSVSQWWAVEPSVGRVADGIPNRLERLKGLGNAVVPQIPELIARRIHQALQL